MFDLLCSAVAERFVVLVCGVTWFMNSKSSVLAGLVFTSLYYSRFLGAKVCLFVEMFTECLHFRFAVLRLHPKTVFQAKI